MRCTARHASGCSPLALPSGVVPRYGNICRLDGRTLASEFLRDLVKELGSLALVDDRYAIHNQDVVEALLVLHLVSEL